MHRIALLAGLTAVLAGCQTTGDVITKSHSELYDGGRSVLYQAGKGATTADQAMRMALSAYQAGDSDQALYQFLRVSELDPKRLDALVWVGRIHRERGNHPLAELALNQVLSEEPEHLEALAELGNVLISMRRYPQAEETLGHALRVDQQRLGNALPVGELTDMALLKVDDKSPLRIYNGLGVLADLDNDFSKAQQYYQLAIRIDPRSTLVANSLGYSHYLAGEWGAARQAYRQALSMDANYKPAWRNYAMLLTRMGRYEEALSAFEQVESRAEASNDVGYICLIEGKLEQAELFFRSAIDQSPSYYQVAWQNLKRVEQVRRIRDAGGNLEVFDLQSSTMSLLPSAPVVSSAAPLQVSTP